MSSFIGVKGAKYLLTREFEACGFLEFKCLTLSHMGF